MSLLRYPEYKDSGVEWLGRVPAHWQVARLKAAITSCKNGIWGEEPKGDDSDIDCVRVADFDRARLVVDGIVPTQRSVTQSERAGRTLRRGDLLLEKSGGGERQSVGQVVLYDRDEPAVCSNFVAKVTLAEGMDSRYWMYQHAAAYAVGVNVVAIKQTSGIQNLDQAQYFDERGVFPSHVEQVEIARFLDRETAKIDALIAEQEKLLALLTEKRQATISHAVTRGLDPNAPMKDSGIPWLGEVPAEWEILPLKRDLAFLTSGSRGWAEHYSDEGALFLRIGNLTRDSVELDLSDVQRVEPPEGSEGERTRVSTGDVLFSITAYLGSVAVVPDDFETAYVSQHVALARLRGKHFLPKWIGYATLSRLGMTYLANQGYGGTKVQLSLDDIACLPLTAPSLPEQQATLDFLEKEIRKLDVVRAESEAAIRLLRERRGALIATAVTGQIDVRGAVEPEAT